MQPAVVETGRRASENRDGPAEIASKVDNLRAILNAAELERKRLACIVHNS
jgi:hypothetical protein